MSVCVVHGPFGTGPSGIFQNMIAHGYGDGLSESLNWFHGSVLTGSRKELKPSGREASIGGLTIPCVLRILQKHFKEDHSMCRVYVTGSLVHAFIIRAIKKHVGDHETLLAFIPSNRELVPEAA